MHTYLIEMLECPACHGTLEWSMIEQNENRIETAEAHCNACTVTYPVREGIGLFLTPELQRNDLWEQVDSGLIQHLREHPELERQLMEVPLDALAPADQFFRALVLEEQGNYFEAQIAENSANQGLYTPEYINCRDRQLDYVVEWLSTTGGPIVDLASGRCYLVEKLVRRLKRPIVATDFSPRVLRGDRRRLKSFGLYDYVSFLAFDARHTPFKDGAVGILTTNLGLPNIEEPGSLLGELRRIVAGAFLAISHFYPEEDEANAKVIYEARLETLLYERTVLKQYAEAGWNVEVKNSCAGEAHPAPAGVVLDGARIDRLPVADTHLEWCVLLGTGRISNSKMNEKTSASALFNLDTVFEVDDYLFAYQDDLTDNRSDAEVASIVKLLELDSPKKILDLACGFGRHTNRLAALGHSVTGVDYMPGFLTLAREKAAEMGVQVDYRQGDMRQISFHEAFDRVLLLFTSFGYFDDEENVLVLKNMVSALKPGGYLMFDIPNRDVFLKDLPPADVIEKDGDLLINRFSFDVLTGRFHNRRIILRKGIRKDKPFSIRLYNATEVCHLLNGAGLVDYKLLNEDGQPLSAASRRIVVIAQKPLRA